ncbi:MAG: hypothetical protein LRY53_07685 [Burkholderiaceae bacterium]|nr:hypothetical protein [Burkholderiaceae bacterium]
MSPATIAIVLGVVVVVLMIAIQIAVGKLLQDSESRNSSTNQTEGLAEKN